MKFDYSFKPNKKSVIIGFYNDSHLEYYKELSKLANIIAEKHSVQLSENLCNYESFDGCLIKHAIVLSENQNPIEASKQYEHLLDWYNTMSLSISYPNHQVMLSWRQTIEELKSKYNGRINYLRPDVCVNGEWISSHQKILDNIICDTVRVKYNPIKDLTFNVELDAEVKNFFLNMSTIYKNYKLFHRSPTDGFISVRYGMGFYITATKTDKINLDLSRLSYIHHYDEASNKLFYSGNYLPSSDVVESALVYRDNPNITALIHTHASDLFTRNPKFKSKIKVGPGSYGVPELGRKINEVINKHYNDFIILEEHGEFFSFACDIVNCHKTLKDILHRS